MAKLKDKATPPPKTEIAVITAEKIDPNSAEADRKVIETLFKMATEDKNTTVAIFWAKVRCGMNDKGSKKDRKIDQAPTIIIRTEEKSA